METCSQMLVQNIIQASYVNGTKVFELIENKFVDCVEGTILDAKVNNEPIIKGNISENIYFD